MAPVMTMTKVRWVGPTAEVEVWGPGRSGEGAAETLESQNDQAPSRGEREQSQTEEPPRSARRCVLVLYGSKLE